MKDDPFFKISSDITLQHFLQLDLCLVTLLCFLNSEIQMLNARGCLCLCSCCVEGREVFNNTLVVDESKCAANPVLKKQSYDNTLPGSPQL